MQKVPPEIAPDRAQNPALLAEGRALLRAMDRAALATLAPGGGPFVSLVAVAPLADGTPVLLLSRLAAHSANLARDSRASLLVAAPAAGPGNPLAGARLTLVGKALPDDDVTEARAAFLARHPDAAGYSDFTDFRFYRFAIADVHIVAGFGRVGRLDPRELLRPTP